MSHDIVDRCEVTCIHEENVQAVRSEMLDADIFQATADFFRNLGDPTRVRLLYALMQNELCVCDLAAVIGASESAVSHQLRILRTQKLVKFRRDGKMLFYSLADHHISTLMAQGLEHVTE